MKSKKQTVEGLFQIVWRDHWNTERFKKSGHAREVEKNYFNHIKKIFGELKLNQVKRTSVKDWHNERLETPIAANRSLETLSKLFNYAISEELFDGANPCFKIKAHVERKRRRYATEEEIKKIGIILDEYIKRAPRPITFIYALLFTGARPRSIERAKWEELTLLDDGFGLLSFNGKSTAESGEEESVIIPPRVMALINKLPRRKDGRIFGIKMPAKIWYKIREEAGCPDLWARDLRRTFATVGRSNGVAMDTIAELLNHRSMQTTKIYAKLYDTAKVSAVKEIADKMTSLLQGNKVVNG